MAAISQRTLYNYYAPVRRILGKSFISPWEIMQTRRSAYNRSQMDLLADTLPFTAELESLRANGVLLFAGPPEPMSFSAVRNLNPAYFVYGRWAGDFGDIDEVGSGWIALQKGPVAGSLGKSWPHQSTLVAEPISVPNIAEAAWCLTTYKAIRDSHLFPTLYARTSSSCLPGHRLYIGGGAISVGCCSDEAETPGLGLLGCQKFLAAQAA